MLQKNKSSPLPRLTFPLAFLSFPLFQHTFDLVPPNIFVRQLEMQEVGVSVQWFCSAIPCFLLLP